jgi:SSS family transporter
MTWLDWAMVIGYAIGLVIFGWRIGTRQKDTRDYYLAGRRINWFPIGLSTMATQLSAISFISAPAFVALRPGGGMIWLGYELAVPLAMLFLMALYFPVFHSMDVISVYEYLERRFDVRVRILISMIFQVSRGLATGVATYAAAIVLSATLSQPLWLTICLVGVVALAYELMGGIHVDIMSDAIQMMVLLAGILACGIVGLHFVGGWNGVVDSLDPARFKAVDFSSFGFGKDTSYGFWPLFVGGFFLYVSYYGCDQSQVQRELATRNLDDCKKSLLLNGLFRFPVVLAYCTVGLIIGAFVLKNPDFLLKVPEGRVDYVVPAFVVHYMPPGLVGLIFVAVMAASMSSLDSAINSLSAVTLEDIYRSFSKGPLSRRKEMMLSKLFTLAWGLVCVGFAFYVENISTTVIEAINKIGSAFYGPIAAVFFLGLFVRRASAIGAIVGLLFGVTVNLALWLFLPQVSWFWWNAIGFLDTMLVGYLVSYLYTAHQTVLFIKVPHETKGWKIWYGLLIIYTTVLIVFLTLFAKIFG